MAEERHRGMNADEALAEVLEDGEREDGVGVEVREEDAILREHRHLIKI